MVVARNASASQQFSGAVVKSLHLVWFLGGYQPRGWLDPRWGTGYDFRKADLYMDCGRMLERGCFDGVLFADQQSIDDTLYGLARCLTA
jgi:hypothetical protein